MPSFKFTPLASSAFTGADEAPLSEGGNWVRITSDTGTWNRTSNQAVNATGTADANYRYVPLGEFRNQYSRANLTVDSTLATSGVGLMVRGQSTVRSWYRFIINHAASNNAYIRRRYTGFTNVTLAQWTQTFTDGDQFTIAIEDYTIYVFDKDMNLVQEFTDKDKPTELKTGHVGISHSSTTTSASLDNWEGGAFSTRPPGIKERRGILLHEPDEGDFHSEVNIKNWFRTKSGLMVPCGA